MKQLALLLAVLCGLHASAQPGAPAGVSLSRQKEWIDSVVNVIDTDPSAVPVHCKLQALKKVLHYIEYTYQNRQGKIAKIQRRFGRGSDSTTQVFYFSNNQLIFSTEFIMSYYTSDAIRDSIPWGGHFYFSNNKLLDQTTLGHGKSETDGWEPEQEVLTNCRAAKADIIRCKKQKQQAARKP